MGPIEAARGLSFEAVFVPGLAEKLFPHKIVEEPILLDALRAQLGGVSITNEDRLAQERLALAIAVGAAERRLYFSYPRLDLDPGSTARALLLRTGSRARRRRSATGFFRTRPAGRDQFPRRGWAGRRLQIRLSPSTMPSTTSLSWIAFSRSRTRTLAQRVICLTANPYLARALRARYQRWSLKWTPADGLVSPSSAASAIMAKHATRRAELLAQLRSRIMRAVPIGSSSRPCTDLRHAKWPNQSMSSIHSSADHSFTTSSSSS